MANDIAKVIRDNCLRLYWTIIIRHNATTTTTATSAATSTTATTPTSAKQTTYITDEDYSDRTSRIFIP
jgi:hypothetical protein